MRSKKPKKPKKTAGRRVRAGSLSSADKRREAARKRLMRAGVLMTPRRSLSPRVD